MKGLKVSREGRNVLGYRIQLSQSRALLVRLLRRRTVATVAANRLRGFDVRSVSPYIFIPNRIEFTLTNPDGTWFR